MSEQLEEQRLLKVKLNACTNVGQMLRVLQERYDMDACEPGFLVKPSLITGFLQAQQMLKPKLKK